MWLISTEAYGHDMITDKSFSWPVAMVAYQKICYRSSALDPALHIIIENNVLTQIAYKGKQQTSDPRIWQ